MSSRFEVLAAQWRRDTACMSVCAKIMRHPLVPKIIAIGKSNPALVFEHYARDGHLVWSSILWAIFRDGPDLSGAGDAVAPGMVGWKVSEVRDAWLAWGRERGWLADDAIRWLQDEPTSSRGD